MKITLEHNSEAAIADIPYIARIEIVTATVDASSVFTVPVYVVSVGQKHIYNLEICGFRVEVEDPTIIPWAAERLLAGLINMARLPSYVFIARRAGGIYPVYTVGNEVFATTPGGPVFRHVELAKVREYLSDYLHQVNVLGAQGLSDKLHVRGIDLKTLGLRRPIFYLKKRVSNQVEFWAPVFESGDGRRIYTYAASARREVLIEGGQEVFRLRELVAQSLQADNRLQDSNDLRPDRLFPATWERLRALLTSEGAVTIAGIDIPLFSSQVIVDRGPIWLGLETRSDEDRYSLFIGRNAADVGRRITQDFERRGKPFSIHDSQFTIHNY